MLYLNNWDIVTGEVPDEITLALNLGHCPHSCPGCHSPELQGNNSKQLYELTEELLIDLVNANSGITCVAFMGGDNDAVTLTKYCSLLHEIGLKSCWYSGYQVDPNNLPSIHESSLDYFKSGPYNESLGPLTSKTTNQRFYKRTGKDFEDITYRFWR